MNEAIEVSYTGDLLSHRRCARSWAYEKLAGFHPYEAVQAMEGRLIHHAMEWLTAEYHDRRNNGTYPSRDELKAQLDRYWRILWAQGIKTKFASKRETIDRIVSNIYRGEGPDEIVRVAIEGARHTEYELRSVRKVLPAQFGGKSKILLTGILDLVVQQTRPLAYPQRWVWTSASELKGKVAQGTPITAQTGDVEIWDYKGTRAKTQYLEDYVRQLLTYAALFAERTGELPARCVLFFVNEPDPDKRLLALEVTEQVVAQALAWTHEEVRALRQTTAVFESGPNLVDAGERALQSQRVGDRLTTETVQQCTGCAFRFDCIEYTAYLGPATTNQDIDVYSVFKN